MANIRLEDLPEEIKIHYARLNRIIITANMVMRASGTIAMIVKNECKLYTPKPREDGAIDWTESVMRVTSCWIENQMNGVWEMIS